MEELQACSVPRRVIGVQRISKLNLSHPMTAQTSQIPYLPARTNEPGDGPCATPALETGWVLRPPL